MRVFSPEVGVAWRASGFRFVSGSGLIAYSGFLITGRASRSTHSGELEYELGLGPWVLGCWG